MARLGAADAFGEQLNTAGQLNTLDHGTPTCDGFIG
jgi:hypothetical protein